MNLGMEDLHLMTVFKRFHFLLLLFLPATTYACECTPSSAVTRFQLSEFVAKAEIVQITPDPLNSDYHDATIKIITLYKGEHLSKIKIRSVLNSSCSFLPSKNSTWIIFATKGDGMLSFGNCSGSMDIGMTFDPIKYPNLAKKYIKDIKLQESVISFLSDNKIFNPNPSLLWANYKDFGYLERYRNNNSFSVFQIDANTDLTIAAVKQLKKFRNNKLNRLVYDNLRKTLKFSGSHYLEPPLRSSRIILFFFFTQEDYSDHSTIKMMNLLE
jgi:hypothetical protein